MNPIIDNKTVILDTRHSLYARLKPVPIRNVVLETGFWRDRIQNNQSVTIDSQFKLLESTGRLDNFRRVSGEIDKPFQGYVYNDSDVYKWLEAACWAMIYRCDENIKEMVDLVITLITNAQDKNGYINTYFSLERVADRWTNLAEKHELYCAGHLIQAAIAHHKVTGEDNLLNVAIRLADHIQSIFGPSLREGTSGHPEIELALVELYRTTGLVKYLDLASVFLDRRGQHFLGGSEYIQDHIPFRKLEHLIGHAVRALYLCSGATDIYLETGDKSILSTLEQLWANMVNQQMYITGGVGARHDLESFGKPYELPNARAYGESCAAVASIMWNWRMLQVEGDPRYADLMEWTLYNAVLPGISLEGNEYFYINPLKDDGTHRRQDWFACACCPPNICRTIAMFPGYMYSVSTGGIWLHLYAQSKAVIELLSGQQVELQQTTSYPWDGHVIIQMNNMASLNSSKENQQETIEFSLFLRLPDWLDACQVEVKINGETFCHTAAPGSYLEIHRSWQVEDTVSIELPMEVRFLESHPMVEENVGRVAVTRGPLLYCLEAADNPNVSVHEVRIKTSELPKADFMPDHLGGVVRLRLTGEVHIIGTEWKNKLYQPISNDKGQLKTRDIEVISVPYFAWANRDPGAMQVWLPYN